MSGPMCRKGLFAIVMCCVTALSLGQFTVALASAPARLDSGNAGPGLNTLPNRLCSASAAGSSLPGGILVEKPPSEGEAPPPDPNVIMQGGDTCATATVIPSLPYSVSGSTVGYTNDYDEACPFSGSTAPDVVYSFTPATDMTVDITLCAGVTNYDTKLYVYQDVCPAPGSGQHIACNDDACNSPVFPNNFISALAGVGLTAGHTYYIVVDGYGSSAGDYTLEVAQWQPPPPPAVCDDPGLLYYQTVIPPDGSWNAFTSGQTSSFDYAVFDNFTSDEFSITDVRWWGLSLFWTGTGFDVCDPAGLTFDVTFHEDDGGLPGAAVCSYTGLTAAHTDTGAGYSGFPLYLWEALDLAPACEPVGATWVSVKSYANPAECTLLWMNADGGDVTSWQHDGSMFTMQAYDMSMCLSGGVAQQTATVTVEVGPAGGGTVTGGGEYDLGTEATVQAFPAPGWVFLYWEVNGSEIPDNPYTFEVTEDITFTAIFERLQVDAIPASGAVGLILLLVLVLGVGVFFLRRL